MCCTANIAAWCKAQSWSLRQVCQWQIQCLCRQSTHPYSGILETYHWTFEHQKWRVLLHCAFWYIGIGFCSCVPHQHRVCQHQAAQMSPHHLCALVPPIFSRSSSPFFVRSSCLTVKRSPPLALISSIPSMISSICSRSKRSCRSIDMGIRSN